MPQTLQVYVGTYTGGKSKGIYSFQMDLANGAVTPPQLAAETDSPSFLAVHPSRRWLYAAGEVGDYGGRKTGSVSAFAIDPRTGQLTLLNRQPSEGVSPCHLTVDKSGRNLLVANYSSGTVCVLPIGEDGRVGAPSDVVQHSGGSLKSIPHAHSVNFDPAGRLAFAADLGLDKIFIYGFDPAKGKLTPHDPPSASVAAGSGPRHLAFHPTGRFAYVINELASTVTVFAYDAQRGTLSEQQTITTLPKDFTGNNTTAEVQVHPTGRFLYGSNRGHDSIAVFAIDGSSGKLTPVEHQPTQGRTPRHFGIDPTGTYLLAANQESDSIVVFRIDPDTGRLTPTGVKIDIPSPVCVVFVPAGK